MCSSRAARGPPRKRHSVGTVVLASIIRHTSTLPSRLIIIIIIIIIIAIEVLHTTDGDTTLFLLLLLGFSAAAAAVRWSLSSPCWQSILANVCMRTAIHTDVRERQRERE